MPAIDYPSLATLNRIDYIMRDVQLRRQLSRLQADLEDALRRVNRLLGFSKARTPRRSRNPNKLDLVRTVLREHPEGLDIQQLVASMRRRGYVFAGDPVKSTRTLLYTRPDEFDSDRGIFTLASRPR